MNASTQQAYHTEEYVEDPTENGRHYDAPAADKACFVLRVITGSDAGAVVALTESAYVLGRERSVDIRVDCLAASRVHARLTRVGSMLMIEDLASRNGTWVDDTRVVGSHVVKEGQRITIGNTVMRVALLDQQELASACALSDAARKDPLTTCFNRGYFDRRLEQEVTRTHRVDHSTSLVMVDLDHFKSINDRHGHIAGDAILRAVGHALSAVTRVEDVVARYGGEEFAVIIPGATNLGAALLAQRLRTAVEQLSVDIGGKTLNITASLGVVTLGRGQKASSAELVLAADEALYVAKAAGRNRVYIGSLRGGSEPAVGDLLLTVTVAPGC